MAISLNDALNLTEDKTRNFQIKFTALDVNRKKGGDIIELTDAFRVGASHSMSNNDTINVKQNGNDHHPHVIHNHLIMEVNHQEIFI